MTRLLTLTWVALFVAGAIGPHAQSRPQRFPMGLPDDPSYFPIAVWLQDPSNAGRYHAAGINLYVGLWEGPTDAQLAALKAARMPVICEQNAVGLAHRDDRTIVGWMHQDEPDNAQPVKDPTTGKESYGPCVPPDKIVAEYRSMHNLDPTRPIMLNLGQGLANDDWEGRGSGARLDDYRTYTKGGDIVSFDVYPVASFAHGENKLWYVPKGVDRLKGWGPPNRRIWCCLECTAIGGEGKVTPEQFRSEAWMALIHGVKGFIYFVHQFKPKFDEHALLDDPVMLQAATNLNREIHLLAPALNTPDDSASVVAKSDSEKAPVDATARRVRDTVYVFAAGMRNASAHASFNVTGLPAEATAVVIGESRTVSIKNGAFDDTFAPFAVHLYRIELPAAR